MARMANRLGFLPAPANNSLIDIQQGQAFSSLISMMMAANCMGQKEWPCTVKN
jgi:hypothetical protein